MFGDAEDGDQLQARYLPTVLCRFPSPCGSPSHASRRSGNALCHPSPGEDLLSLPTLQGDYRWYVNTRQALTVAAQGGR